MENIGFGILRRFGRKNLSQQDSPLIKRRVNRRASNLTETGTEGRKSLNFSQKKNNLIYINTRFTK